jgi:hypothetical protein
MYGWMYGEYGFIWGSVIWIEIDLLQVRQIAL